MEIFIPNRLTTIIDAFLFSRMFFMFFRTGFQKDVNDNNEELLRLMWV